MCRLLECNKAYLQKTKKEDLLIFLDQLEKSCGGHGNGIAFVDGGKVTFTFKSTQLTNKDIVEILYNKMTPLPEWFLYHTRVASAGSIKDENCHPYVNEDGSFALMMNGTDRTFGALGEERDITDTQVIYEIFESLKYPIKSLTNYSPRFMGVRDGKVFATNPTATYQSLKFVDDEGAICIASEFPLGYADVKTMKSGYAWFEGEEIKEEPKVVYNNSDWWRKAYGYENNVIEYSVVTGKGNSRIDEVKIEVDGAKEVEKEYPCDNCKKPVEACATCKFLDMYEESEPEYTLDEVKEKLNKLKLINKRTSFTNLQKDIDDIFGYNIIIDGLLHYIEVLDTKQILIINENSEVIEIE